MDISKRPKLTRADLALSFGAAAFPVHVWAIINLFNVIPAWLLRFSIGELSGAIGYTLGDALIESAAVWLALVLFGLILPSKWMADQFVCVSSLFAWLLTGWAMAIQFNFSAVLRWSSGLVVAGFASVVLTFAGVYWLERRFPKIREWVNNLAQKLTVVTYVYVAFDLLGLVIVLIRNL